jgi:peroxiredoxin
VSDITATGTRIVVVSADAVDDNARVVERLGLEFPILSDSGRTAITAFGVVHEGGGLGGTDIARPAAFLIEPDGTVVWRNLTSNWRVRLDPEDVIRAVQTVGGR